MGEPSLNPIKGSRGGTVSRLVSLITILTLNWSAYAVSPELAEQFLALRSADRPQTVTFTLNEMSQKILQKVGGKPFTAHQFLGFSGASYFDLDRYKEELVERAIELNQQTLRQNGDEAVTVYILGATYDGFGVAYHLLQELIDSGRIRNALVTGMASDEAINFHLEGLEKGWGHVIAPSQNIAYFKKTFTDANGNRSWELKTSPESESDTPKILKNLSRYPNAGTMTFNVFGGGFQAFNETLEMILESRNRPHQVQIRLYSSHRPGKPAKDTGYRAADMLAYVLVENPFLLNEKIDVQVISENLDRIMEIQQYSTSASFLQMRDDASNAADRLLDLNSRAISPETQALINYYEVLEKLNQLPLREIENFRSRTSYDLMEARQRLLERQALAPFEEQSIFDRVDKCITCNADIEQIARRYRQRLQDCSNLLDE